MYLYIAEMEEHQCDRWHRPCVQDWLSSTQGSKLHSCKNINVCVLGGILARADALLTPALRRQREVDLCTFKPSQEFRVCGSENLKKRLGVGSGLGKRKGLGAGSVLGGKALNHTCTTGKLTHSQNLFQGLKTFGLIKVVL